MDFSSRSKKTRGPNEPVPEIPQQHFLKVAPLNPEGVPYVGPPLDQSNTPSTPSGVVALTGSAAMRPARPTLGLVDIGESEDSYLFRVSLPGVAVLERDISCDIYPDGRIFIQGVTTTGSEHIVCKNSEVFRMQTQNLCQPGRFMIHFQLPGPVNTQIDPIKNLGSNGFMECIVKKM